MAARFARAVITLRYAIALAWVAAAVLVTLTLPTLREAQVGALGDLVPTESEAVEAELRSNRLFGFPLLSRTVVVQRDADGLSAVEQAAVARTAVAVNRNTAPELTGIAGALPVTNALGAPPFARESSTTAITYLFFRPETEAVDRDRLVERFLAHARSLQDEGFVGATGALAARAAQAETIEDALPLVELGTVLVVALAVALHFRALGAPLVNLLAVGVSYLVSIRLVAFIGERIGVSVPSEVEPVIVVLLFGVVTDYSIFFLARFRAHLTAGAAPHDAAAGATSELLGIVVTAGLTVVAASSALAAANLGFFRAFGPGMAMAVLVALVVAVTLLPALLAIGGRTVFWPRRSAAASNSRVPADAAEHRPRRSRAVSLAAGRPWSVAAATTLVLLAAGTGVLLLEPANPLIRGLPADSSSRQAFAAAAEGFAPGILSPTVVVVEGEGIAARRRELRRLQRLLERQPGVAEVAGPADQPLGRPLGAALSKTGDAARYLVVLRTDPLGGAAVDAFRRLRMRSDELLAAAGLPRAIASFAGDTALVEETVRRTGSDLGRVTPVALAAVFLVLALFLRGIVAPLYLLAASVLALAAALGLATYVFQVVLGHGEMTYYVPFAAAVLLLALGSDYNVLLAGRIWQEARTRPLREAVAVGGAAASTAITVAGVVLAASFALLALVPIRPFRELAFTMTAGLLIDAFIVRTLLVPALISIFGQRAAWTARQRAPTAAVATEQSE